MVVMVKTLGLYSCNYSSYIRLRNHPTHNSDFVYIHLVHKRTQDYHFCTRLRHPKRRTVDYNLYPIKAVFFSLSATKICFLHDFNGYDLKIGS